MQHLHQWARFELKHILKLRSTLHICSLLRGYMSSFVASLQHYFMVEVCHLPCSPSLSARSIFGSLPHPLPLFFLLPSFLIPPILVVCQVLETSWVRFCHSLEKTKRMDDIIAAHSTYIDEISAKIAMQHITSPPSSSSSSSSSTPSASTSPSAAPSLPVSLALRDRIEGLFAVIFNFDTALEMIYASAQSAALSPSLRHSLLFPTLSSLSLSLTRDQLETTRKRRLELQQLRAQGLWGRDSDTAPLAPVELNVKIVSFLKGVGQDYLQQYNILVRLVRTAMGIDPVQLVFVPTFLQTAEPYERWSPFVGSEPTAPISSVL
jgi:hypothetical protein